MGKTLRLFGEHGNDHPHKSILPASAFLVVSILFGIAFVFITPPFQVADEPHHFFRSYQVSEGGLIPEIHREPGGKITKIGGVIPKSIYKIHIETYSQKKDKRVDLDKHIFALLDIPLNPHIRSYHSFSNIARYPFVPYVPQAIGIALGRTIGLCPLLLMYLGRLANLAVWIFLVYSSIRIIPTGRWVLFLAALTPMSLFTAASLSGDTATNGLSFLFIALMMRYGLDGGVHLTLRGKVLIYALGVLLALCRTPYFLVVFLFLIVPADRFGSRIGYWAFFGSLIATVIALNVGWHLMTDLDVYTHLGSRKGVSSHDQIPLMLADPLNYAEVMLRTFWKGKLGLLRSHFGVLGWLNIHVPRLLIYLYASVLTVTAVIDGNDAVSVRPFQRIVIFGIFLGMAAAIFTALYAIGTPVGAPTIRGLQGRYFIAFSPLFYLAFNNRLAGHKARMLAGIDKDSAARSLAVVLSLFAIGSSAVALWTVVTKYYM
jgi:uncharacterized membrane protein